MAAPPERFTSLADLHEELLVEFTAHQYALLHRDFAAARAKLADFTVHLERHIAAEEELFDACFAHATDVTRRDPSMGRAPVDLFTGEHKHFRAMLREFERDAGRLDAADVDVDERVLQLLDDETTFKEFFRHHDERERNLLYPAFDELIPAERRAELLRRFHEANGSVPPVGAPREVR
jgi:hemerythrin-like domain-containing protein